MVATCAGSREPHDAVVGRHVRRIEGAIWFVGLHVRRVGGAAPPAPVRCSARTSLRALFRGDPPRRAVPPCKAQSLDPSRPASPPRLTMSVSSRSCLATPVDDVRLVTFRLATPVDDVRLVTFRSPAWSIVSPRHVPPPTPVDDVRLVTFRLAAWLIASSRHVPRPAPAWRRLARQALTRDVLSLGGPW